MLVGLYVLFKYLNKDYLNYLFTAYFGLIGIFAVSNVCIPGFPGTPLHSLSLRGPEGSDEPELFKLVIQFGLLCCFCGFCCLG